MEFIIGARFQAGYYLRLAEAGPLGTDMSIEDSCCQSRRDFTEFRLLVYLEASAGQIERIPSAYQPVVARPEELNSAGDQPVLPMCGLYKQGSGPAELGGSQRVVRRSPSTPASAPATKLMDRLATAVAAIHTGLVL